jgi:hypothetical protein
MDLPILRDTDVVVHLGLELAAVQSYQSSCARYFPRINTALVCHCRAPRGRPFVASRCPRSRHGDQADNREVEQALLKSHGTTFLRYRQHGMETPCALEDAVHRGLQVALVATSDVPTRDCHPGRGRPQPSPRGSGLGVAMGCSGSIAPLARGPSRATCRATSTRRSTGTDCCRRSYAAASRRMTAGDDDP